MLDNSQMEDDSRETFSGRDEQRETDQSLPPSEAIGPQDLKLTDEADALAHSPYAGETTGGSYFKPGGSVPMRRKIFTLLSGGAILLVVAATLFTSFSPASSQKSEPPRRFLKKQMT